MGLILKRKLLFCACCGWAFKEMGEIQRFAASGCSTHWQFGLIGVSVLFVLGA